MGTYRVLSKSGYKNTGQVFGNLPVSYLFSILFIIFRYIY